MGTIPTCTNILKRIIFIPYNMSIAHYGLDSSKIDKKEASSKLEFRFPTGKLRRNDPYVSV